MNPANLQLEGLLVAFAAVNQALVAHGLLSTEEIYRALAVAEHTALGHDRVTEDLSPANRDAHTAVDVGDVFHSRRGDDGAAGNIQVVVVVDL